MFPNCRGPVSRARCQAVPVEAPRVARKRKAGQFVIVRVHEHGERIPLDDCRLRPESGTITIIVQGIGKTTKQLNSLKAGDHPADVVGPLGKPSEIERFGTVVVIGGGVGTAIAYPTAKALEGGRQPRHLHRRRAHARSW